jgi:uncharacterized protein YneF (UPF0154 family)
MAKASPLQSLADWFTKWDDDKIRATLSVTLAILTGLLLGMVIDTIFRQIGNYVFPPPPTFDMASHEDIKALLDTIPAEVYVIKLVAWTLGTFGGAYLAVRMAKVGLFPAWITAILLVAGYMIQMTLVPHPMWVVFVASGLSVAAAIGGAFLAQYVTHQQLRRDTL